MEAIVQSLLTEVGNSQTANEVLSDPIQHNSDGLWQSQFYKPQSLQ
jgi:hypothetical protein